MKIPVRYNHVGYAPDAAKIFFVNPAELPETDLANIRMSAFGRVIFRES